MTLILDTSDLPPGRRTDAIAEVIEFSGVPARVTYNTPDDEVQARFEYFTMGESHILSSHASAQGLVTTRAMLKNADADVLIAAMNLTGTAHHSHAAGRLLRAGDIFAVRLWEPYEYFRSTGEIAAFHIPLDRLRLPRDYVARAGARLLASPLAAQLRRHLQILFRDAGAISRGPAAAMVGQATTDLVRATILAAVDDEPFRPGSMQPSAVTVIKSFIAQNLADPDLGAEQLARAMFVSVRQVYKFWETEPCPLGQWITQCRLEAARDELTSPRGRDRTTASIARHWGFADATHFGRRFRQAYGMSPREWRHAHRPATTPDASAEYRPDRSMRA
jgi:AraC-like DNA-binding protein